MNPNDYTDLSTYMCEGRFRCAVNASVPVYKGVYSPTHTHVGRFQCAVNASVPVYK